MAATRDRAEAGMLPWQKPLTEKAVMDAVLRAAEERSLASDGLVGGRRPGIRIVIFFFSLALLVSTVPVMFRSGRGLSLFGGAPTLYFCVANWLPSNIASMVGLSNCGPSITTLPPGTIVSANASQTTTATKYVGLTNATSAITTLVNVVAGSDSVSTIAGRVITVGGILWTLVITMALLYYSRCDLIWFALFFN
jgi:hypothetical protein